MSFNVKDDKLIISRMISYLSNACSVQSSEASSAYQTIKQLYDEQGKEEKRLSEEQDKKITQLAKQAETSINADEDYLNKIIELNSKLSSVDKKYAKRDSAITFAGISEKLKKEVLSAIGYKDHPDLQVVKKLYEFFKEKSFRYISKPISPLLIATKKRLEQYDALSCCVILAQEYCKENKQAYIDHRDEEVKRVKEEAAQQALNLRKRYAIKIAKAQQESQSDNDFLVEESRRTLSEIFNEEFLSAYTSTRERTKKNFEELYEHNEFPEEIYLGDFAYNLPDRITTNPIGKDFLANNSKLFENEVLFLPWTLSLSDCQSLFITPSSTADKAQAASFVNQIIYAFMRQLPFNGLELSVFDPDKRGNSIFPFLSLPALMPEMFSKKIFTSSEDIASRIAELNQYVDSVIQQKLSNKYENILEYNAATPDNPLPIKLVCIFDFPKAFEPRSYENLLSIIRNASRCGIFVVCCYSPNEQKNSFGDLTALIQEIKGATIGLLQSRNMLYLENSPFAILPVELPQQAIIDDYCIKYEQYCKKKLSQGIPFISIVKEGDYFTKQSAEGLSLPVGKGDGSATQFIEFGKRSSQHAIITGATGSGKSTLLHTLIMSALINYSPDELNLYLMDFKGGTEFKIYESHKVPHIKLLALDALQEFGESILMELVEEQNRRSQLFKDNGELTSLKAYVAKTGQIMPRILVIMDEFQILFNDSSNRKVALHCAELANKIVTEGRAFGIHLVMATQTLRSIREKTALSSSTIEQMRIRIGLKCGEEDANYIFGDSNARDALQKMKGAIGTAVYNAEYTEANNEGFRVAYCPEVEQKNLLTSIQQACKGKWETKTKVFEGKRIPDFPSELLDNSKTKTAELILEIGEPIRIDDPVRIAFGKKKNNNLLIVGSDNNLMSRLISLMVLEGSISEGTILHYVDGNAFFDEAIDPYIGHLTEKGLPIEVVSCRKDLILMVDSLYEEFKKRRKSVSSATDRHLVIINGLQYLDILCNMLKGDTINRDDYIPPAIETVNLDEDDWGIKNFEQDSDDYSSKIKELIESGYAYGLHFVISCNEYQVIREVLHYGAGLLNKLNNRIVFAINDKDSDDLINGIQVSGMNNITAVYSDGIKKILQFKPYGLPTIK